MLLLMLPPSKFDEKIKSWERNKSMSKWIKSYERSADRGKERKKKKEREKKWRRKIRKANIYAMITSHDTIRKNKII